MSEERSRPDQVRTVNDPRHFSNKTFNSYFEYIKAINDIGGPERYLELLDNAIASLESAKRYNEKKARGLLPDPDDDPRFLIGSANRPNWLGKILARNFPSFRPRPPFHLPLVTTYDITDPKPRGPAVPWLNVFEEWYTQEKPPLTFQAFAEVLIQLYTKLVYAKEKKAKKHTRYYEYVMELWSDPSRYTADFFDVLGAIAMTVKPEFRDQNKDKVLIEARRIIAQGSKQIGVPIR